MDLALNNLQRLRCHKTKQTTKTYFLKIEKKIDNDEEIIK